MKFLHASILTTLLGLSVLFGANPASAHSDLQSTTPSSGETVEAGNITVALMFTENLLTTGEKANVVSVQGPSGPENAQWADGCIDSVRGPLMSEAVSLSKPGDYVVNWRAVSADGHPIEGSFDFKVVNTTGYESETPGQCANSALDENGTQLLPITEESAKKQFAFSVTPEEGLIGGLVVITAISIVGALMLRSQERKREAAELAAKLARDKKS